MSSGDAGLMRDEAVLGDEHGFTLLEATIALAVVSIAIIALATGLLVTIRSDNQSNLQQRTNLALGTFVDNLAYVAPATVCTPVSSPPPTSSSADAADASHARSLLQATLAKPEVARLADDGMLFTVTNVAYADRSQVDAEVEEFTAPCDAPPPANPPYFPVIKVSVTACWAGSRSATTCSPDSVAVSTESVERGSRTG